MNPQKIINILCLLFAVIVAEKCFSHGDDLDDVVRCKFCKHSLEICSHLKSCERYKPEIGQLSAVKEQGHNDKKEDDKKTGWFRGSGVLSILSGSGNVADPFIFRPRNEILNIVVLLKLPDHLVDFIQVTTTEPAVDASNEESTEIIPPLSFPPPVEIVEIHTSEIDTYIENAELPVQHTATENEVTQLGENPIFIHFEQHMTILDYTFPGDSIANLLLHINIPEWSGLPQVLSVASSSVSGLGGQVIVANNLMDFGVESLVDGTYLLIAHDKELYEWFTAIVIVYKKYALLFLLDERGSLVTLVSSRKIFSQGLKKLAGIITQQSACYVEEISDFDLFLYPLEFSATPMVDVATLDAAITEHKAQKEEEKMDVTETGAPHPVQPSFLVQMGVMGSMDALWQAGNIPGIFPEGAFCVAQPVVQIPHAEVVNSMLKRQFILLQHTPAGFSGTITSESLFSAVQGAVDGNGIAFDMLQAMFLSLGVSFEELPENEETINGMFLFVIKSESELEPPALLFVNIERFQTTIWSVNLNNGMVIWNIYSSTKSEFLHYLEDLGLCTVDIYRLN